MLYEDGRVDVRSFDQSIYFYQVWMVRRGSRYAVNDRMQYVRSTQGRKQGRKASIVRGLIINRTCRTERTEVPVWPPRVRRGMDCMRTQRTTAARHDAPSTRSEQRAGQHECRGGHPGMLGVQPLDDGTVFQISEKAVDTETKRGVPTVSNERTGASFHRHRGKRNLRAEPNVPRAASAIRVVGCPWFVSLHSRAHRRLERVCRNVVDSEPSKACTGGCDIGSLQDSALLSGLGGDLRRRDPDTGKPAPLMPRWLRRGPGRLHAVFSENATVFPDAVRKQLAVRGARTQTTEADRASPSGSIGRQEIRDRSEESQL